MRSRQAPEAVCVLQQGVLARPMWRRHRGEGGLVPGAGDRRNSYRKRLFEKSDHDQRSGRRFPQGRADPVWNRQQKLRALLDRCAGQSHDSAAHRDGWRRPDRGRHQRHPRRHQRRLVHDRGGPKRDVRNSDWGPCDAPGGPCYGISGFYEGQNRIAECHGCATTTNNILIENNVVHDYTISPRSGAHSECFWINGGGNVTFRGNRIYNCTTTAWSIGEHSRQLLTGTWVIEGNWIGKTHNASSLNLTQYPYTGRMIVRNNSFGPNSTLGTEEGGTDTGTMSAYRNIFGRWDDWCIPGATYRDNLFVDDYGGERGRLCGGKGDRLRSSAMSTTVLRLVADRPAADAVRSAFALVADGKVSRCSSSRDLARLRKKAPSGGWTAAMFERSSLTESISVAGWESRRGTWRSSNQRRGSAHSG